MSYTYTRELIDNAMNYARYRADIEGRIAAPPAGEQADKMLPYMRKHASMMAAFDLSYRVSDLMRAALNEARPAIWLVLTEGWCGDAAYSCPLFAAIEKAAADKIKLRFLLRDQHPDLMDAHLTDGARSIPKLICLSPELHELGSWGPRPAQLHEQVREWKDAGLTLKELIPKVHDWYMADDTRSMQSELAELVRSYT